MHTKIILSITGLLSFAMFTSAAPAESAIAKGHNLPTDAQNGIYVLSLNDDNTYEYKYAGVPSAAAFEASRASSTNLTKRADIQAHCSGFVIADDTDLTFAQSQFAAFLYDNRCFSSRQSASVYQSAVAFGCNYGSEACQTDAGFYSDISGVDDLCGTDGAGYYFHSDNEDSFGRTSTGQSFC